MQQHNYHRFFLPILFKLYEERNNDKFIDINDCLNGTLDQNVTIVRNLKQSEFALIKEDKKINMNVANSLTIKFSAKILPLGIDYVETCMIDYMKANQKKPSVGFKSNK